MKSRMKGGVAWALGAMLACAGAAQAADMSGALSILLRDPDTGELGVAVLSHAPACGSFVPWVEAGVGVIATQGETNGSWGPRGLQMLRDGVPVQGVVDSLMHSDEGYPRRQIGVLDATGWPAGYTGNDLVNWSGGILDSNLAAQGNTMPNHLVIEAVMDTVKGLTRLPLAERLLAGLELADQRRGDWRGARSAALLVGRPNPARPEDATRFISLRVDDDPAPVVALERLYRAWRAGRLVGAYLDYADAYRRADRPALAQVELRRARGAVTEALADTTLGAPALNAMAWQLAQRGAMLDQAWAAIARAQLAEPRSTEFTDTAAEVRYRQGRVADALALATEASKRVPPDEYLRSRVGFFTAEAKKQPAAGGGRSGKKKG
ncbi:MAG: DUF1028 domain-containing protein [Candidatus Eisenbacteria bacterium]